MSLLFLFLFVIYCLAEGTGVGVVLAAVALLGIVVSHISTFLYAPLVLLPAVEAYRSRDRRLALFACSAFGLLLVSIPLGLYFSPYYLRSVYTFSFRFLPVEDPGRAAFGAVLASCSAGLALSLAVLAHARRREPETHRDVERGRPGRLLSFSIRALILAVLIGSGAISCSAGPTCSFGRGPRPEPGAPVACTRPGAGAPSHTSTW